MRRVSYWVALVAWLSFAALPWVRILYRDVPPVELVLCAVFWLVVGALSSVWSNQVEPKA